MKEKDKRYIWTAKWKNSPPSYEGGLSAILWSVYMSITPDLKVPVSIALGTHSENTATIDLLDMMEKYNYKYDFVVVEHPEKLICPFKDWGEQICHYTL
jgi:hypothetical protein